MVCGALQDKRRAHVGCGVMEVKDNIIGIGASFRSKDLIDFLGSLNFVWQLVSRRHAVERETFMCHVKSLVWYKTAVKGKAMNLSLKWLHAVPLLNHVRIITVQFKTKSATACCYVRDTS